ncbi:MAG: ABC transporter ATP-binding protein [Myxococcales bacterium]|nr:ABC transporter ATP-binding protein [Myxococcales bacterium]MCB9702338.1 ABC transporter ATP-binding protein [Myxococcales bacterium]
MDVELRDIGKTYDGATWAVQDLSLSIPSGSIFGLIGPNGAGKSTTLRMLATVVNPSTGTLLFDGQPAPADASELRGKIGFLGDGNPLYKEMSPAEYLRFYGQCYRIPPRELEDAIEDTLVTFDLAQKRDTPSGQLSKGMRQRLLIARCLLHRPRLLLLDEPADGLDPRSRADLRSILLKTRERGVTILVSSHILRELDDLCDQMAIIQRGRLVVAGSVDEIIRGYDVSRLVYRIRVLGELGPALAVLREKRALVEATGTEDGLPCVTVQVQGDDALMAEIIAALVEAKVKVVTASRLRGRIEDVYNRLSEDRVN